MSKNTKYRKITLRCYDPDLIAWLDALPTSYGTKSQAINAALKQGAGLVNNNQSNFDLEAVLGAIRQVVEAALVSSLGRYPLVSGSADAEYLEDRDEVEALLARFDDNFDLDRTEED